MAGGSSQMKKPPDKKPGPSPLGMHLTHSGASAARHGAHRKCAGDNPVSL